MRARGDFCASKLPVDELEILIRIFYSAALKIKVILCEILMNYDVSFPAGESTTPKGFAFNVFTMPNPTARLVFAKRKA